MWLVPLVQSLPMLVLAKSLSIAPGALHRSDIPFALHSNVGLRFHFAFLATSSYTSCCELHLSSSKFALVFALCAGSIIGF